MDLDALKEAVINGDAKGCTVLTEVAIQAGHSPQKVLTEALVPAMQVVGDKFRCNEVYVPEVLVAARAMKKSLGLLKPLLTQTGAKPVGTAEIGTVFYDKNPGQETALKQMTLNKPTDNSKGLRFGYFSQIRDINDSEFEAIFSGQKTAKKGLDDAVATGNKLVEKFQKENK